MKMPFLKRFLTIVQTYSGNMDYQCYAAMTQNNLGLALRDMERLGEPKERYERAREMREQLLKSDAGNTQYQVYVATIQNFEEMHSDKTAASCLGCACLYNGLKKFRNGVMSDKLKLISEAHEEFKRASSFYQRAESEVGADVISTINSVVSGIEEYYDTLNRALQEGRKLGIAEYRPVYENINNLIEQVSAVGLKNMFKAYIFDDATNLVDEKKPEIARAPTDFKGNVILGDVTIIQNPTLINNSVVENSFNEEVNKPEPKKSVLKSLWGGIVKALLAVIASEAILKLITLLNP